MRMAGHLFDRITPHLKLEIPVTAEGMIYATRWVEMDNSLVERELDFEFRPVEETMADCIRWLCAAGHITQEQAGTLAAD